MSTEPIDLQREEKAIQKACLITFIACCLGFPLGYWTLPLIFDFPTDLINRLAFALQGSIFVLIWVLIGVIMVATKRRKSVADIGGSASAPPSSRIAIEVAFLQNTLEQAVLAVGMYLALATLISGVWLSLIVVAIIFFGVGRIFFLIGYRRQPHLARGRAFGMVLTMLPTLFGYGLFLVLIVLSWFNN